MDIGSQLAWIYIKECDCWIHSLIFNNVSVQQLSWEVPGNLTAFLSQYKPALADPCVTIISLLFQVIHTKNSNLSFWRLQLKSVGEMVFKVFHWFLCFCVLN